MAVGISSRYFAFILDDRFFILFELNTRDQEKRYFGLYLRTITSIAMEDIPESLLYFTVCFSLTPFLTHNQFLLITLQFSI